MARARWGQLLGLFLLFSSLPLQAGVQNVCYLIDTDFGPDDLMAIPVLLGTGKVAAIISTEGYSLAPEGSAALAKLYASTGLEANVPVIRGMTYSGPLPRDLSAFPWLPPTRTVMQRANNYLSAAINTTGDALQTPKKLAAQVAKSVSECRKVSVLMIAPFSSFVHYESAISSKINEVVMQGRPYDASQPVETQAFNCQYDINPCIEVFQKSSKRKDRLWIDAPRVKLPDGKSAYQPTVEMVNQLEENGLPGVVRVALLGYQATWNAYDPSFTSGSSRLWDQSAALYFIRPHVFQPSASGNFKEPTGISANDLQDLWAASVNHWNRLPRTYFSIY